jgi:outer membrane protein
MRARVVALLAGLTAAAPLQAQTPTPTPTPLSFAEAVRRAAGGAPAVALAALEVDAAEARAREARGALLPSLTLGAAWVNRDFNSQSIGISFPGIPKLIGPFNNYDARLTATQTLFDFASVARLRAARARVSGSDAEQSGAVEAAAQRAALAYLGLVRAEASVAARRADSTIAQELAGLAERQKEAGVSAAIDVTRARTQLVVAEGLLVVAQNQEDRARIDLARALGLDPATRLEPTDSLTPEIAAAAVPGAEDAAVSAALAGRPDLQAEVARGEAARRTGTAITAERLPRLSVEGDYGPNGLTVPGAIATRQVALEVSIPILDGLRRAGRLAEQHAIAQQSAVREADLRQRVAAEVRTAFLDQRSAAAQEAIAAERLRLAESELDQARQRFRAGVAGNIEVIDAQGSLIQARDADIDARYSAAVARVALARAVGVAHTLH